MKKTLFSFAFLAVSGAYVANANHAFDGLTPQTPRRDEAALVIPSTATSSVPLVSEPGRPAADTAAISGLAAYSRQPSVVAPRAVEPTPSAAPASLPKIANVSPAEPTMPPVPRPRPVHAPSVQPAQASATAAANGTQYRDGSYTGTSENAYYGRVKVEVTIASGRITSVRALDYPSDRRTSRYINGQALPMLEQEVIQAQNASVDTVSGATLTSNAYIRSLGNALSRAGGSNA